MDFHNTSGLNTSPQNVLLCGLVILGTQTIKIVQETEKENRNYYSRSLVSILIAKDFWHLLDPFGLDLWLATKAFEWRGFSWEIVSILEKTLYLANYDHYFVEDVFPLVLLGFI